MALFFKTDAFLRQSDIEKLTAQLEEKTGEDCVLSPPYIQQANPRVFFLCDRTKCVNCDPECRHTTDISHAVNFHAHVIDGADSGYWEGDDNVPV